MAETYGFYDTEKLVDGTYDREYIAQQWADYFKLFIGTGVFASPTNQLKVVAGEGMNIIVKEGWAFIEGRWYHNDADLIIPVQPNTTASTITSGVFIQANSSDRVIKAVIATGRTTPDREAPYYELELAQIQLATGTTSITNSMITDMRTDESVCGFVKGLLEGVIPTADLFLQFETQFNTWFNHMKDQLDTDAAGHLQAEIDDTNTAISAIRSQQTSQNTKITALENSLKDLNNDWYEFDVISDVSTDNADYTYRWTDSASAAEKYTGYRNALEGREELLVTLVDKYDVIYGMQKIISPMSTITKGFSVIFTADYRGTVVGKSYRAEISFLLSKNSDYMRTRTYRNVDDGFVNTLHIKVYRHKKYQPS